MDRYGHHHGHRHSHRPVIPHGFAGLHHGHLYRPPPPFPSGYGFLGMIGDHRGHLYRPPPPFPSGYGFLGMIGDHRGHGPPPFGGFRSHRHHHPCHSHDNRGKGRGFRHVGSQICVVCPNVDHPNNDVPESGCDGELHLATTSENPQSGPCDVADVSPTLDVENLGSYSLEWKQKYIHHLGLRRHFYHKHRGSYGFHRGLMMLRLHPGFGFHNGNPGFSHEDVVLRHRHAHMEKHMKCRVKRCTSSSTSGSGAGSRSGRRCRHATPEPRLNEIEDRVKPSTAQAVVETKEALGLMAINETKANVVSDADVDR